MTTTHTRLNIEPAIAILDDEPEMRKALRRLLILRGFRVEEYACGEDLLAAMSSHPLKLLLLDLHMPGINGFSILEAFHSRLIHVPVIVITAHDEPGTEEQVRALGAVAFLKKPIDRDALLSAIAEATSHDKKIAKSLAGDEEEH